MDLFSICCKKHKKILETFILVSESDSAEMSSLVPAVHAMSDETSPLSTSEDTAQRPGKDNELFQQFLPERAHNAIHLPDSSEAKPPSSACSSAQRYALVSSLCIPLHPSTTLHRSSQSVFGH